MIAVVSGLTSTLDYQQRTRDYMKNIIDCVPDLTQAVDYRPMITHECVCGSPLFRVICSFADNEIAQYFLDMECIACGSRYHAPTLADEDE